MSDFLDFMDIDRFVDIDANGLPDVHEASFIRTYGDTVPDAINPAIDMDGNGVPDHAEQHVDLDGNGIDYRDYVDSGGDGLNDWDDPFSPHPGTGLSPELKHYLAVQLSNPFR